MPTYSYRCTECGEAFDIQQAFTDDTLTVCPNCGGPLRKLFNTVGVTFNGSGFYRTDSRAKPAAEGGSSSSAADSSSSPAPSAPAAAASSTPAASGTKESKAPSSAKE